MTPEDIARTVVYSFVALPAVLFVLTYIWLLRRLRVTTETMHLIGFTAVIAYIVIDFMVAIVLGWWAFSLTRFLSVLTIAGLFLWQRYYLLLKYNVIPRIRRDRIQRQMKKATDSDPVH